MNSLGLYQLRKQSLEFKTSFFARIEPFYDYLKIELKVLTLNKLNKHESIEDYFNYVAEVIYKISKRLECNEFEKISLTLFGNGNFSITLEKNSQIVTLDSNELFFNKFNLCKFIDNGSELKDIHYRDNKGVLRSISGLYENKKSGYFISYEYKLKNKSLYISKRNLNKSLQFKSLKIEI